MTHINIRVVGPAGVTLACDAALQKITTFLMFEGHAEEAMHYGPGGAGAEGTFERARFTLAGQSFMCIDSPAAHGFGFTPSMSWYVRCEPAEEIDRLYDALRGVMATDGGLRLTPHPRG